jgi:hypothetical protein
MDKTVKISHENSLSKVGNIIILTNKLLNIEKSNIESNSEKPLNEFEENIKENEFIVDETNIDEIIEGLIAEGRLTRVCTCGKCGINNQIVDNHKSE